MKSPIELLQTSAFYLLKETVRGLASISARAFANLKEDGIWTYRWDAENRLIGLTNKLSVVPNADLKLLVFTCDPF